MVPANCQYISSFNVFLLTNEHPAMSLQQVRSTLDKINRLYQSITMDEGVLDTYEKELMLSYIRQLYHTVEGLPERQVKDQPIPDPRAKKPAAVEPALSPTPPPVKKSEEAPEQILQKPAPEPVVVVAEPVQEPEPVQELTTLTVKEEVVTTHVEEQIAVQVETVIITEEAVIPTPPAPKKNKISEEMEAIFQHIAFQDLAEKLSQSPVDDIFKALSLNDRLQMARELFGSDKQSFEAVVRTLNGLNSFDEARDYLISLFALRYQWDHPEKSKTAKDFVRAVRRRFIKNN